MSTFEILVLAALAILILEVALAKGDGGSAKLLNDKLDAIREDLSLLMSFEDEDGSRIERVLVGQLNAIRHEVFQLGRTPPPGIAVSNLFGTSLSDKLDAIGVTLDQISRTVAGKDKS